MNTMNHKITAVILMVLIAVSSFSAYTENRSKHEMVSRIEWG